jgi:hypothetical protein
MERLFERTCKLSQNSRALQCSSKVQRKPKASYLGQHPKATIQEAAKGKDIAYDSSPYPSIGKTWQMRLKRNIELTSSSGSNTSDTSSSSAYAKR